MTSTYGIDRMFLRIRQKIYFRTVYIKKIKYTYIKWLYLIQCRYVLQYVSIFTAFVFVVILGFDCVDFIVDYSIHRQSPFSSSSVFFPLETFKDTYTHLILYLIYTYLINNCYILSTCLHIETLFYIPK